MNDKKKEPLKRVCENSDCDNLRPLAIMSEDGKHNFAPHIINGEQKNVCIACKIKLSQSKRGRNGF